MNKSKSLGLAIAAAGALSMTGVAGGYAASPSPTPSPSATATSLPSAKPVSAMSPAVAVIDSGVPTSLFPNIVDEVCILEYSLCPNGKSAMDGVGAANIAPSTNMTLTHGTEMLSIISKVNPGVKLIPIRIVGVLPNGLPYIYSNNAVKLALDWIVANRVKYNITVVNISQGKIFAGCSVPAGTAQDVAVLKANNVAVIASSGNDSNRTAMDSIACLPDVVSVGATDNPDPGVTGKPYDPSAKPYIARYSNGTPQTSFYLNARWYVLQPNGKTKFYVGSSNATAAMSGWWSLNYQGDWQATYDYMVKSAQVASNEWLSGRYIDLPFAMDK